MRTFMDIERSTVPELSPHLPKRARRHSLEDMKLDFYQKSPWLAFAVHFIDPMNLLWLGFLKGDDADGGEMFWQWCFWRGSPARSQLWG